MADKKKVKKTPIVKTETKKKVEKADNILDMLFQGFTDVKTAADKSEIHYMPLPITSLNRAIKLGGAPMGTVWEIHGPNSGGKSALLQIILGHAQKLGHIVSLCDAERASNDKSWMIKLGLDPAKCGYFNPECFEDAAKRINKAILNFKKAKKEGKIPKDKYFLIGIDSVAKLVPRKEVEGEVGDSNFGLIANLMSQWLRTLTPLVGDKVGEAPTDVLIVFINHERANVGASQYEKKFKSFGGEALQFEAHVRLRVTASFVKEKDVKGKDRVVGKQHEVLVEKNKVGEPMEKATFFTNSNGYDYIREAITEAAFRGVIEKEGKKYLYDSEVLGDGIKKACKYLQEHEDTLDEIIQALNDDIINKVDNYLTEQENDADDDDVF